MDRSRSTVWETLTYTISHTFSNCDVISTLITPLLNSKVENICEKFLVAYGKCKLNLQTLVTSSLPLICDGKFFGFLISAHKNERDIDRFHWSRVSGYTDWIQKLTQEENAIISDDSKYFKKPRLYEKLETNPPMIKKPETKKPQIDVIPKDTKRDISQANEEILKTRSKIGLPKYIAKKIEIPKDETETNKPTISIQKVEKVDGPGALNDFLSNVNWENLFAKRMENLGVNPFESKNIVENRLQQSILGNKEYFPKSFGPNQYNPNQFEQNENVRRFGYGQDQLAPLPMEENAFGRKQVSRGQSKFGPLPPQSQWQSYGKNLFDKGPFMRRTTIGKLFLEKNRNRK